MKIKSFSVSNYRSITRAHKIEMHDLTILVGKSNEGKSNIIKVLSLSMKILNSHAILSRRSDFPSSIEVDRYSKDAIVCKNIINRLKQQLVSML